jgi:hypothetical protein
VIVSRMSCEPFIEHLSLSCELRRGMNRGKAGPFRSDEAADRRENSRQKETATRSARNSFKCVNVATRLVATGESSQKTGDLSMKILRLRDMPRHAQ